MICHCKEVPEKEIKSLLRKHPDASLKEVIQFTGASTGCGKCYPTLRKIVEELRPTQPPQQKRLEFPEK